MTRHLGIKLDKSKLEYICEEGNGKYRWYFDTESRRYVCLNEKEGKFAYNIPYDQFCTFDELLARKMRRYIRDGLNEFVPPEKLKSICAPKSQAILKLCQHKEKLMKKEAK